MIAITQCITGLIIGACTFMIKNRMRIIKTLTSEWNQAMDIPRPGSKVGSQTFVQVKLSNKELIHSLGISYTGK